MTNTRSEKLMKGIRIIFLSFSLILALYLALGELLIPCALSQHRSFYEAYGQPWTYREGDSAVKSIPNDSAIPYREGDSFVLYTTLPEHITDNTYLCIDSQYANWTAYVGDTGTTADEVRNSYHSRDIRDYAKANVSLLGTIPLSREDAGQQLTLVITADTRGTFYLSNTIYGDGLGIYKYYFVHYGAYLLAAIFLTLFSLVVIVFCIVLRILQKRSFDLLYLAIGIAYASIWMILNSTLIELLLPNAYVSSETNFLIVMFLTLPFCIYIDNLQEHRYQKGFIVAGIGTFVVCIISTVLYVTNIMDYHASFYLSAIFAGMEILYIIITLILHSRLKNAKRHRLVSIGVIIAALSGLAQIVSYVVIIVNFSGLWLTIGMTMLLILASIDTFVDMINLEKDKEKADAANSAKSSFLASMSHEIRTPINSVIGMNEMILRSTSDKEIREYALDVDNAAKNLLGIVNEILDISKIESGKMRITETEYALSSLLHDTMNLIQPKADAKDLTFQADFNPELPAHLYGDDMRLRQILVNLLTNAVKYTNEGSVTLKVDRKNIDGAFHLCVQVTDTGIGIKEEDLKHLFDKFERFDENRNRNVEGTGLGMAITYQLLGLMNSQLQVSSVYGKGSTFSFTLKQGVIGTQKLGHLSERIRELRSEYHYQTAFEAPDVKLLIVDDNQMNRKVFVNLLRDTKMQIDQAESGFECLTLTREKKYDIIFLDHMMPGMDGVQTLQELRKDQTAPNSTTPVVALTANAIAGAKEMYLSYGFDYFLSKPIEHKEMLRILEALVPKERRLKPDVRVLPASDFAPLPPIPGISWELATEHIGAADLILAAVKDFYKTIEYEAEELSELYDRLDNANTINVYRVKIHAMKTMLMTIGIEDLSNLAKMLEHAASENRIERIHELHTPFLTEWYHYKELLQPIAEAGQAAKIPIKDYSLIQNLLDTLLEAVRDLDVDAADSAMEKLSRYAYPKEVATAMSRLEAAVLNLDEDAVATLTGEIRQYITKPERNND